MGTHVWVCQNPPFLCLTATSWEESSHSPGHAQLLANGRMTTSSPHPQLSVLPHSHCPESGFLIPGRGEQGSLFYPGLAGRQGEGGPQRGSGVATQCSHLPSVPPTPLPPPSPLRLRVHRSGDPWELEANFPRSLVMERPQVLPLIKVRHGAVEERCMQASSSHLQKPYANN